MIVAYLLYLSMLMNAISIDDIPKEPPILSSYIWYADGLDTKLDDYINFCQERHVTSLYVQYSDSVDNHVYKRFITKAHEAKMTIHLLDGAPDWCLENKENILTNRLSWLEDYQSTASSQEKFDGLHLDIEFYLLNLNSIEEQAAVERYMSLIKTANIFCDDHNLDLSSSIPFWFDEVSISTAEGSENLAQWHIQQVPYTVIMAYRNITFGRNSIASLVKEELDYAQESEHHILIALETAISNEGDHISFYNSSKLDLDKALLSLTIFFSQYDSFKGFAIHYLDTWMVLYDT